MSQIGERIEKFVKTRPGLTIRGLAKAAGFSYRTWYNRKDIGDFTEKEFVGMAAYIGVSVDTLKYGSEVERLSTADCELLAETCRAVQNYLAEHKGISIGDIGRDRFFSVVVYLFNESRAHGRLEPRRVADVVNLAFGT